jgi:pimeloyl-ACP methyl ester carboxylesterase
VDLLDALEEARAHLVGVSMGAAAALQVALTHPERTLSALLCSIGTGSDAPAEQFQSSAEAIARLIEQHGLAGLAAHMGRSPSRRKLKDKDPAAFQSFTEQLMGLSALGAANTMRAVQKRRAAVYACESALTMLTVPVLVVHGADDADCRKPCEFIARTAPHGRLERVENTGHAVNLEELERFNRLCTAFIDGVDRRMGAP